MRNKNTLSAKVREAIQSLLNDGIMESGEIIARLEAMGFKGVGGQQVGGLITLHKRKMAGDLSADFRTAENAPERLEEPRNPESADPAAKGAPAPNFPTDGFNWAGGSGNGPGAGGFSFGQVRLEYHIWRRGPTNDGFLGVEPEGFTLEKLGQKYGSGTYDIVLYVNDKKSRVVQEIVSAVYGAPKFPRAGGSSLPRLIPEGEKPRIDAGAGELSETVRAVKDLHTMVKESAAGAGAEGKVLDRALDLLASKPPAPPQDSVLAILQANQQLERDRWEREEKARNERWEKEQKERHEREERDRKEAEAKHDREMARMKAEFDMRQQEAIRQATEKDRRDEEYRKFVASLERDREKRLEEAINQTNTSIQGLQAAHAEDLEKERAHQAELAKLQREQLDLDRARLQEETKANREHMTQIYELQLKAIPNSAGRTEEMICNTIKDVVIRADQKFSDTLEMKKIQELTKLLGEDNAKQLAMAYLAQGGLGLKGMFSTKPAPKADPAPAGAAPAAGATPPTPESGAPEAETDSGVLKGDGMNKIAEQVYETPFFTDLLEIWGGHLRLKRSPYLFANQMAEFMVEDRRVALFYNYMAARTWDEFLPEIKAKIPPAKLPLFEGEAAAKFYDTVIELISKRIEKDHVDRGIVPDAVEQPTEESAKP